jgi:hypothetical protein
MVEFVTAQLYLQWISEYRIARERYNMLDRINRLSRLILDLRSCAKKEKVNGISQYIRLAYSDLRSEIIKLHGGNKIEVLRLDGLILALLRVVALKDYKKIVDYCNEIYSLLKYLGREYV